VWRQIELGNHVVGDLGWTTDLRGEHRERGVVLSSPVGISTGRAA
jgi:hypothetical protein